MIRNPVLITACSSVKLLVCKSTLPGLSLLLASYVLMFLSDSETPHVKHIISTYHVKASATAQNT